MVCEFCNANIISPNTCQQLCDQVSFYTLAHADQNFFIHQLVVDAYAAEHATENDKPIKLAFALIGLYLFAEKGYTGKEVQNAHIWLANRPSQYKQWPAFQKAAGVAQVNVGNVLEAVEGKERDEMIKTWAKSVWQANSNNRQEVINFLATTGFIV